MKRVMTFGTFDVLHEGHMHYLKQAKKQGDYLIVVVGRDSTVKRMKGKKPKYGERTRIARVRKIDFVDKVCLGNKNDFYYHIKKEKPDVICIGYDQKSVLMDNKKLEELGLKKIKIKRISPYKPHKYKSSIIINSRLVKKGNKFLK